MKKLLFVLSLCSSSLCFAQNTLNVHQKDGAVMSYGFSEKPVVTYTETGVHLATAKVAVDYPFENLEKFTFSDDVTALEAVRTVGTSDDIRIFNANGLLVRTIRQHEGTATFSTSDLPQGIYIIKNGKTTFKITKR